MNIKDYFYDEKAEKAKSFSLKVGLFNPITFFQCVDEIVQYNSDILDNLLDIENITKIPTSGSINIQKRLREKNVYLSLRDAKDIDNALRKVMSKEYVLSIAFFFLDNYPKEHILKLASNIIEKSQKDESISNIKNKLIDFEKMPLSLLKQIEKYLR